MKTAKLSVLLTLIILFSGLVASAYSQEGSIAVLSKQIMDSGDCAQAMPYLEQAKDLYFKDYKYSEFADFLKSLIAKKQGLNLCANYYVALSRFSQLKYLEQEQSWDEYFSKGNDYRSDITESAQKVLESTQAKDELNLKTRFILWQFHASQQDAFSQQALASLMSGVQEYAKGPVDMQLVKEIAAQLQALGEKAKAQQLYKIYADNLVISNISDDDLIKSAGEFRKDGNLELSETIYDIYIDRILKTLPKEESGLILSDIAKSFSFAYSYANSFLPDPVYSEKLFQKLDGLGIVQDFDEELLYQRAYNLEKSKEFSGAKDRYSELLMRFPEGIYANEARFKVAVINAYVLRDIKAATEAFSALSGDDTAAAYRIASLYQLGLLSQWQEEDEAAGKYYGKLIELAKTDFPQTLSMAQARLGEIENGKPMEYNLKVFLDATFKEENSNLNMSKVDLAAKPVSAAIDSAVEFGSTAFAEQSGCMQVQMDYLWSGDLGAGSPSSKDPDFSTQFSEPGTKVISVVVMTPTGIIDRSIAIVDIK
jgi:TolA-binding protein